MIKFPEIPDYENFHTEFYLAGGCVRDHLLNVPYSDKDFVIVTNLTFDQVCTWIDFSGDGNKVYLAKPEFMTIRCKLQDQDIDITWPRIEKGYKDFRHPDKVEETTSLVEDAFRRDFTINAMYMDKEGNILDFLSGKNDLSYKILRTPLDPYLTFKDDYLRIVRLIRFAVKYSFATTNEVFQAAFQNVPRLVDVPFERIRDELNKALKINPSLTFDWLDSLEMYPILEHLGLTFQLTAKDLKNV